MRKAGVFFVFMCGLSACNNPPEDIFAPEILRFELNETNLDVGETLELDIEVADDEELNQMRIRIREAFAKSFGHWELIDIIDLQGLSHSATYPFVLPDTALAGLYEVSLQVVDWRGNATLDSLQSFFIGQPGLQPNMSAFTTIPAPQDEVLVVPSDGTIQFSGFISDANGLGEVRIEFRGSDNRSIGNNVYNLTDSIPVLTWDAATETDTIFVAQFPQPLARIVVKALSETGHQSRKSIDVSLFP